MEIKLVKPDVKLLEITEMPLHKIERAAKTCYASNLAEDEEERTLFIHKLLRKKHLTPFEFADVTFEILTDRGVMAELTRHRLASFNIQSTRYVKQDKQLTFILPHFIQLQEIEFSSIPDFFDYLHVESEDKVIGSEECFFSAIYNIADKYDYMINTLKMPAQNARAILPNCLATKITMKCNFREMFHILNLRMSKDAHPDMRIIATKMYQLLNHKLPEIFNESIFNV